jgi:hypothetical protein
MEDTIKLVHTHKHMQRNDISQGQIRAVKWDIDHDNQELLRKSHEMLLCEK